MDYGGTDVIFIERNMGVWMLISLNGLWRYICYFHLTDYEGIDVICIGRIMGGIDVIFIERILEI